MEIELQDIIKIHKVQKNYNVIFNELNYTFYPGNLYYIYAPYVSGKTTLLNLLSLQMKYDEGNFYYNKKSISNMLPHEKTKLRKRISYVQESTNLSSNLTIKENLLLPLRVQLLEEKHKEKIVTDYLLKYGMSDKADFYPDSLSEEERQRICIMRALLIKPDLLLLDEPFIKLSKEIVERIKSQLLIMKNSGCTIILTSKYKRVIDEVQINLKIENRKLIEEHA